MGKRGKNKGRNGNKKNNKSENSNCTKDDVVDTSEDDSLKNMDALLVEAGLDIKYTGTGK